MIYQLARLIGSVLMRLVCNAAAVEERECKTVKCCFDLRVDSKTYQ